MDERILDHKSSGKIIARRHAGCGPVPWETRRAGQQTLRLKPPFDQHVPLTYLVHGKVEPGCPELFFDLRNREGCTKRAEEIIF